MLRFTNDTKMKKEERCFPKLIAVMNVEFQRDINERSMLKMQKFQQPERHVVEDVYLFWIKFNKIVAGVQSGNLEIKLEMVFLRSTHALDSTAGERLSILSDMNASGDPYSVANLRTATRKLTSKPLRMGSIHDDDEPWADETWDGENVMLVKPKKT